MLYDFIAINGEFIRVGRNEDNRINPARNRFGEIADENRLPVQVHPPLLCEGQVRDPI